MHDAKGIHSSDGCVARWHDPICAFTVTAAACSRLHYRPVSLSSPSHRPQPHMQPMECDVVLAFKWHLRIAHVIVTCCCALNASRRRGFASWDESGALGHGHSGRKPLPAHSADLALSHTHGGSKSMAGRSATVVVASGGCVACAFAA